MKTRLLRLWGLLPTPVQRFLVYLGSPKVTLGVSAIIPDRQGRLLLVRHTYRRPAWDFPSGMVGRREQPAAALARELEEELGVRATIGPLLHAAQYAHEHHLTLYYRASIDGTPRHGVETSAHRYVDVNDLPALRGEPVPPWLRALVDAG